MKTLMLLVTSSLVVVASGALAQGKADPCHNQYGSCMERCSSSPQLAQDTCSQACETTTNQCYGKTYGSPAPREAKRAQGSKAGKKAATSPPRMQPAPQAQAPEWPPAPLPPAPPVAQAPQPGTAN